MLKNSLLLGSCLTILLTGCGEDTTKPAAKPEAPAAHEHAAGEDHAGSHMQAEAMVKSTAADMEAELKNAAESSKLVKFLSPADKATVGTTFKVVMGIEGMEVKPAGAIEATSGHHHIIIDGAPIEAGKPVPADAQHIHFGKAQTETELTLTPGVHTLTLQFANGAHLSYGPAMSSTITVTVK